MKKFLPLLFTVILFGMTSTKVHAATMSLSPTTQSASANSTANVAVNISGSPTAYDFQFTITYNPTYLSIDSSSNVTLGNFLPAGSGLSVDLSQNSAGVAIIGGYVMGSTPSGTSDSLVNIVFTTKSVNGTGTVTLSNGFVDDTSFNNVTMASYTNGSVTVGTVAPTPTLTPIPPTATPIPSNTPVPPTPTKTPTPALSNTPIPTATPTLAPTNAALTVSFRLQGITTAVSAQNITATIKNGASVVKTQTSSLTPTSDGLYSMSVSSIPSGTLKVCLKGQSHLQRCFNNVTFTANQTTTLNKGVNSSDLLLVGDVNNDNSITIDDVSLISTAYTSFSQPAATYPPVDVNHDGRITIDDLALATLNYSNFQLPGDN